MANVLDKRGVFWWLNGTIGQTASVETSVPGAITISDEGQIKLDLEGSLWFEETSGSVRWDEPRWLAHGKRIVGRLGEYGDGGYVLLDDIERTDFPLSDEKPSRQSYEAELCFSSDSPFAETFDLDRFRELRIELLGLDEWLGLDSIRLEEQYLEGEDAEVKVKYKNHKITYNTPVANVYVESLILGAGPWFGFLSDLPQNQVNIRQTNWLIYAPTTECKLNDFQIAYRRIEELITLLLGTHFRLDWPILVGGDGKFDAWYKLYFYRGPAQHQLPPSYFRWTAFFSVRDSFGELLHQWQTKVERYGAGYELYVASLQNPLPYPEHRFVNVVWAIESLHRNWQREAGESARVTKRKQCIQKIIERFNDPTDKKARKWLTSRLKYAHEPNLEERIVEAFSRLPIGLETGQLRAFAERCAKRRNNISHEGGCRSDEDPHAFRAELQNLTDALVCLFHALLLHQIGIGTDQLKAAMTKGGLAEVKILPALRRVGIDMPLTENCR